MPESDEQRTIRRGISHWLTEQINNVTITPALNRGVRILVLEALANIDRRFDELRQQMQERYHVRPDRPLVGFYMKGGNAFKVSMEQGLSHGGDSDWDTQVILDPFAPAPLLEVLHGLVEDIVLDELRQSGVSIAGEVAAQAPVFDRDIAAAWDRVSATAVEGYDLSNYELGYDNPQQLRRIFDHEKLGLWFHSNTPLKVRSAATESKWLPGMSFNDAIQPFILYRMGYTWHAALKTGLDTAKPSEPIDKPILMELIDVTIPRRTTVEGVEVWDEIEHQAITVQPEQVGFAGTVQRLPFPDIYYHLREQLDMLCEVADGSSRHQDKMPKRFDRLEKIFNKTGIDTPKVLRTIYQQVGVEELESQAPGGPIQVSARLFNLVDQLPTAERNLFAPVLPSEGATQLNPGRRPYRLGILMMNQVTAAVEREEAAFVDGRLAPAKIDQLTQAAAGCDLFRRLQQSGAIDFALSDDLVLLEQLGRDGYLQLDKVGLSGVDLAAICRVRTDEDLLSTMQVVADYVARQSGIAEKHQSYSTARENGLSYEVIFILSVKGKARMMLTLTTASKEDVDFGPLPAVYPRPGFQLAAPLAEVARQRKMAASMIQDYILRTALGRQYRAGEETLELG